MAKVEEKKPFRVYKEKKGPNTVLSILSILAIAGLLIVGYFLFLKPDSARSQMGAEETLFNYSALVAPYVSQGGILPQPSVVDEWLSYFDGPSQAYIRDNADAIARYRLQFEMERFEKLSRNGKLAEAFHAIVNRPPLGGIARVVEQSESGDGALTVRVQGATTGTYTMQMRRQQGIWVIENLGGIRESLDRDIERFRAIGETVE